MLHRNCLTCTVGINYMYVHNKCMYPITTFKSSISHTSSRPTRPAHLQYVHASFKFPLQLQLQEKEDKNFFFSENDENQDQVLIHLLLLIRMGTQRSPVNNRRLAKTKHGRERGVEEGSSL